MPPVDALVLYFSVISVISFLITVLDKVFAIFHFWRIPEAALLFFAMAGGSPVMIITMLAIRHKTRKLKFMLGLPVILIIQAVLAFILIVESGLIAF